MEQEPTKEIKHQPKKIFIELGTESIPVTFLGKRKFGEEELYIGIDINREDLENAREATKLKQQSLDNIHFIQSDATKLPLKDKIANQVFLGNLLGDPSVSDHQKDIFIKEAKRILKEGGEVIIKENNTPISVFEVRKLLERNGFKIKPEKSATPVSPDKWQKILEPYHEATTKEDGQLRSQKDAYIIHAKLSD